MARRHTPSDHADIDLLDLLDGAAERIEQQRRLDSEVAALRQLLEHRRAGRPDGLPVPRGEDWCGRCGENTFAYGLVINHDLGYLGCPVAVDPTCVIGGTDSSFPTACAGTRGECTPMPATPPGASPATPCGCSIYRARGPRCGSRVRDPHRQLTRSAGQQRSQWRTQRERWVPHRLR